MINYFVTNFAITKIWLHFGGEPTRGKEINSKDSAGFLMELDRTGKFLCHIRSNNAL